MELNKLIKNVFTEEQIGYLRDIAFNGETHLCQERGRNDVFIGPDIRQDIKDKVKSYFDEGYELYHVTYSEYSPDHGIPNLPEHRDPKYDHTSLTFDYQFEANVIWPMCAEGICHDMKDNDALIFDPQNMDHLRPPRDFKPGDYVRVFFFFLKKV